jgi:hypothetical protein
VVFRFFSLHVIITSLLLMYGLSSTCNPLLIVVVMVKNEESVIRATLQPFIDAGIDSYLIFDTGSTDKTMEVTRSFFAEHNIQNGYIVQEPFIDFATSRNHALRKAEEIFPDAEFILMPDAEWYINDAQALVLFCQKCLEREDIYPSYLMHIVTDFFDNYVCRLFRCRHEVRFSGVVHEYVIQQTSIKVPDSIYFHYAPESKGLKKSIERFERDRTLLCAEYEKNPHDARTLFYLARTCEDQGDLEAAYYFYKKRIEIINWPEEDFIARYRLAEVIKKLVLYKEDNDFQWIEALEYYLQTYRMRSHRIEPIIAIADYYFKNNKMELAYVFSLLAAHIPYPSRDLLFIEKYIYNYYRYKILYQSACQINETKIAQWAKTKLEK